MIREMLQKARATLIEHCVPPPLEVRLTTSNLDKLAIEMRNIGEIGEGEIPTRFLDMALIPVWDAPATSIYVGQS